MEKPCCSVHKSIFIDFQGELYLLHGRLLQRQHGGVETLPAPGQLGAGLHGVGHRALVVLARVDITL